MNIKRIKRSVRERLLDNIEDSREAADKELHRYVMRSLNACSIDELRSFTASRLIGECVGQVKASRRKGWKVNGREVTDMLHNVDELVIPEAMMTADQAKSVIGRNQINISGRLIAHADLIRRLERQHELSEEAKRRRRKLDSFIRSWC